MDREWTPGPWLYRPDPYDDWGYVKTGAAGERSIVAVARGPYQTDEQLGMHRRNKTDPYEANARLIAAAPELYEALLDAVGDLETIAEVRGDIIDTSAYRAALRKATTA